RCFRPRSCVVALSGSHFCVPFHQFDFMVSPVLPADTPRGTTRVPILNGFICSLVLTLALTVVFDGAHAQRIDPDVAVRLNEAQTRAYVHYLRAKSLHDRKTDAYWREIEDL